MLFEYKAGAAGGSAKRQGKKSDDQFGPAVAGQIVAGDIYIPEGFRDKPAIVGSDFLPGLIGPRPIVFANKLGDERTIIAEIVRLQDDNIDMNVG